MRQREHQKRKYYEEAQRLIEANTKALNVAELENRANESLTIILTLLLDNSLATVSPNL